MRRSKRPKRWLIGWRIRARFARNPLLRRRGAAERLVQLGVGLLLAALLGSVVLTVTSVFAAAMDRGDPAHQAQRQLTATVTSTSETTLGDPDSATVVLSWKWQGQTRTASEPAAQQWAKSGDTAKVWVDSSGRLAQPPSTTGEAILASVVAGAAVALGGALLSGYAITAFRGWSLRRSARAWEQEWAQIAPVWRRRHGWH